MSDELKRKIENAAFNFYLEADSETIKDILKDDIENSEEYNKKKKQLIFLSTAKLKKQHNDYLLSLAERFRQGINQNIEKPIAILKQLIQSNASLAFYRNLNQLSAEDIIEIIKDKNLVELIEQLEDDESKNGSPS